MALAVELQNRSSSIEGVEQLAYKQIATALEVIPRTLAQNCGADVVRVVTELRVSCPFSFPLPMKFISELFSI